MFTDYRRSQALWHSGTATCTESATPGSSGSLVSTLCYDVKGCCVEEQATASPAAELMAARSVRYATCVAGADSPEEKLACIASG